MVSLGYLKVNPNGSIEITDKYIKYINDNDRFHTKDKCKVLLDRASVRRVYYVKSNNYYLGFLYSSIYMVAKLFEKSICNKE